MKRLAFLLLACFMLQSALAISTTLKPVYQPQETLIFEIQGNILEALGRSNIEFLRGHVTTVFDYDIKNIDGKYFIYAIASSSENNYTLVLHDIVTTISGKTTVLDYQQNFSVQGETIPYTINPGFILTDSDFTFLVTSNRDVDQTIQVSRPTNRSVVIKPGQNTLAFSINDFVPGLNVLSIGSYSIPAYIIKPKEIPKRALSLLPDRFEFVLIRGENRIFPVRIINTGEQDIAHFVFDYDKDLYIVTPTPPSTLRVNESVNLNITLKSLNNSIKDTITITAGNETYYIPFSVNYTTRAQLPTNRSANSTFNGTNSTISSGYYCYELQGKICAAGETCSEATVESLNGPCCKGTCAIEQTSYAWIGYLIGAIVLVVLIIVGGRYLKTRKPTKDNLEKKVHSLEGKGPTFS